MTRERVTEIGVWQIGGRAGPGGKNGVFGTQEWVNLGSENFQFNLVPKSWDFHSFSLSEWPMHWQEKNQYTCFFKQIFVNSNWIFRYKRLPSNGRWWWRRRERLDHTWRFKKKEKGSEFILFLIFYIRRNGRLTGWAAGCAPIAQEKAFHSCEFYPTTTEMTLFKLVMVVIYISHVFRLVWAN